MITLAAADTYSDEIKLLAICLTILVIVVTTIVKLTPLVLKKLDNIVNKHSFKQPPTSCNNKDCSNQQQQIKKP